METWDAIRARRNVREFTDQAVSADDLGRILEAGRRAPSAKNTQPWDFVVITERGRMVEMSGVWRGAWHVARAPALVALVVPDLEEERERANARFDLGQAVMSMMLMAADLGLGTCHASVGDQDLAREILGHPDGYSCGHLFTIGYPADRPIKVIRNPNRRPLDEVVHRQRW
jgi:nitroreductase